MGALPCFLPFLQWKINSVLSCLPLWMAGEEVVKISHILVAVGVRGLLYLGHSI